jgi:3-phosphoshikimate 1-carboxyvinyltransferase
MIEGNSILTADSQLSHRPMLHLLDGLKQVGVKIESKNGYPPIKILGTGRIQGGVIKIPGNISSQYVSAILLVSPLAQKQITLRLTTPLESKPYVKMTMNTMSQFGYCPRSSDDMKEYCTPLGQYNPTNITIEGDWSSAAFILAAGVLSGEITVRNLSPASDQADKLILEILAKMNANISYSKNEVTAWKSSLSPLNYDLSNCPDLFPIVAALCSKAEGTSVLSGLRRLRIKESDRVKAMIVGLNRMGINIKVCEDTVKIIGGDLKGANIDTYNDHRIAMAFAVLSSVAKGKTIIKNSECVNKSYPNFWDDMITIGLDAKEEIK